MQELHSTPALAALAMMRVVTRAQRIAASGAFLVTSEMALFQLCGDAKVSHLLLSNCPPC